MNIMLLYYGKINKYSFKPGSTHTHTHNFDLLSVARAFYVKIAINLVD